MNIQPYNAAQLARITKPTGLAGEVEFYPRTLFDTADLPTSNTPTSLTFFNTARTGLATNLETPGALPSPKYFCIHSIHVTPLVPATEADAASAWDDMDQIVRATNGNVDLRIQDKSYGPWKIQEAHGLGGLTGFGYAEAASAGTEVHEYANNGFPGLGINIQGTLWLTPNANFRITLEWDSAPSISADVPIVVAMKGVEYRAVV